MDPTTTLAEIRRITGAHADPERCTREELEDLWTLTSDLDQWLSRGGFLPEPWHTARMNSFPVPK